MTAFVPERKYTVADILKELVPFFIIGLLFIVVLFFIDPEGLAKISFFIPVLLLIQQVYDKASEDRVVSVQFDTDNQVATFSYKMLFSSTEILRIPFSELRIETVPHKEWPAKEALLKLYIIQNGKEKLGLSEHKDLFSQHSIKSLTIFAYENGILIREYL